jgi:predicted outer membrane protein
MSARTSRPALLGTVAVLGLAATPAMASAKSYSPMDEQALTSSIQGDRFEIAAGRLAESRGSVPIVRRLGARLAKDHTKSLKESVKLARSLGISVPKRPTPSERWEIAVISYNRDGAFDRLYTTLEVQDHRQDITEAKDEVDGGCNRDVVADARKELPVLRIHLKLSKRARHAVQR